MLRGGWRQRLGFVWLKEKDLFKNLPFCLETPHDSIVEYADEIQLVRTLANVG